MNKIFTILLLSCSIVIAQEQVIQRGGTAGTNGASLSFSATNRVVYSSSLTTASTITNATDGWVMVYDASVPGGVKGLSTFPGAGKRLAIDKNIPTAVDGVGCTRIADGASELSRHAQFSGTAAAAGNYCRFSFLTPWDLDTNQTVILKTFAYAPAAGDTAQETYIISMYTAAQSTIIDGTYVNPITISRTDAAGAAADAEYISDTTLTSWNSSMIPGQWIIVKVARDGNDASTQASYLLGFTITYVSNQ